VSGKALFDGGGDAERMGPVQPYQTPIVARGRIYVAGNRGVYAFRGAGN
jgi:hypothetical protein